MDEYRNYMYFTYSINPVSVEFISYISLQKWRPFFQRDLEGHYGDVYTCRFFPSGIVVLSGGADMQLKVWSAETGKCAANIIGHTAGKTSGRLIQNVWAVWCRCRVQTDIFVIDLIPSFLAGPDCSMLVFYKPCRSLLDTQYWLYSGFGLYCLLRSMQAFYIHAKPFQKEPVHVLFCHV